MNNTLHDLYHSDIIDDNTIITVKKHVEGLGVIGCCRGEWYTDRIFDYFQSELSEITIHPNSNELEVVLCSSEDQHLTKTLFLVENSGNEGYFYEPMYYTSKESACRCAKHWENIGDTAKITKYRVTDKVYVYIDEHYAGHICSLYTLLDDGFSRSEIDACLEV